MKLRHRQAAAALLATGALWAGCALSKTGFHALSLHFTLAESVAAAQQHLVHSSFYPHDVKVKGFFVRVSGHLAAPADSDLPTQVKVTVINEDVDSGLVTYRFKLTVNVAPDGTFEATKKYRRDVAANTLQSVNVKPVGAAASEGTEIWFCLDVAKKKADFPPTCGAETDAKTVEIVLLDNRFEPQQVTINPGDTVRWVLEGSSPLHTTTEMDGTWDSGFVFNEAGNFFERTFPESEDGMTFMYFCTTHHFSDAMQGSVLVGLGASPPENGY